MQCSEDPTEMPFSPIKLFGIFLGDICLSRVFSRTQALHSSSIYFSQQCFLDKEWGVNTPIWMNQIMFFLASPIFPSISSDLPPWLDAFLGHIGRVPCCFTRETVKLGTFIGADRMCFNSALEKKMVPICWPDTLSQKFFNHCNCSLFYILPAFCVTLQPPSCLPDFVYTSSSLDFKFVEGNDLFL